MMKYKRPTYIPRDTSKVVPPKAAIISAEAGTGPDWWLGECTKVTFEVEGQTFSTCILYDMEEGLARMLHILSRLGTEYIVDDTGRGVIGMSAMRAR